MLHISALPTIVDILPKAYWGLLSSAVIINFSKACYSKLYVLVYCVPQGHGFVGTMLRILRGFLAGRTFAMNVGTAHSQISQVNFGVAPVLVPGSPSF